ncbi:MAG: hypothetical protein A2156_09530 [Deltaproteobacteria bacterium RBG_16_48_10]|nr:MAG: hypothetical protein A2156_09530 [Deltaproteobacteria bacterium RBG_16_48_10]
MLEVLKGALNSGNHPLSRRQFLKQLGAVSIIGISALGVPALGTLKGETKPVIKEKVNFVVIDPPSYGVS